MATTAAYKKTLSKGPMPLNGKVLDDYDEEDDFYEEEEFDEQSPVPKYDNNQPLFASKKMVQSPAKKGKKLF